MKIKPKKSLGQNFLKIKPNKMLGQNFLHSRKIVDNIVHVAGIKQGDVVLEIGPGKGILTEALLKKVVCSEFCPKPSLGHGKVVAVEKDNQLVEFLREKFSNEIKNEKLILSHGDILDFNASSCNLDDKPYKVVANIPYYLTGKLFRKFLENPPAGGQPSVMVLMVQKEVGERIIATPKKRKTLGLSGKESILSISVKAYGVPKIVKNVSAKYFSPAPKVDSVVLKISDISKDFFNKNKIKEKAFFELVKKGFARKRKMLRNNLDCEASLFTICGVAENARAENLSAKDWLCLYSALRKPKLGLK